MKDLGFNTLVQLLERVEGVKVMKPPDAGFMMVYGPQKKGKKMGSRGEGNCSSDGCLSSENEGVSLRFTLYPRPSSLPLLPILPPSSLQPPKAAWFSSLSLHQAVDLTAQNVGSVRHSRPHTQLSLCAADRREHDANTRVPAGGFESVSTTAAKEMYTC